MEMKSFQELVFKIILYKDTLILDPGCYKIDLIDTDHDGLNFFANNDGAGYFQIRKPTGAPLAGFDSDFGDQITHYFTVGYGLSDELNHSHSSLRCFPNPATSKINVELNGFTGQVEVEVLDALHKKFALKKFTLAYLPNKLILIFLD